VVHNVLGSCDIMPYNKGMNEVQRIIGELEERGWTLAAIARELEVSWKTVHRWKHGSREPHHARLIILGLERLRARRRIPKRKLYTSKKKSLSLERLRVSTTKPPKGAWPY
jgi:transposase-like protein